MYGSFLGQCGILSRWRIIKIFLNFFPSMRLSAQLNVIYFMALDVYPNGLLYWWIIMFITFVNSEKFSSNMSCCIPCFPNSCDFCFYPVADIFSFLIYLVCIALAYTKTKFKMIILYFTGNYWISIFRADFWVICLIWLGLFQNRCMLW
jgi:hypothetical protein